MDPLGLTSRWTAAGRARESARPDRLFEDPFAAALAGDEGFALLDEMAPGGRENTTFAVRTRFFDDFLIDATSTGLRQVVILAAGMDTRAYRLLLPPGISVYEIDQPEVLTAKQQGLAGRSARPVCQWAAVGADLTGDWPPTLLGAGFHPEEPAVFIAEGLLMYLSEPAVHRLLHETGRLAAPGSLLGTDLQSRTSIDHPWMADWLRAMASRGMGWKFGTDDPGGLLEEHGWQAQVTEFVDVARRLGRYPTEPIPEAIAADVAAVSRAYLVQARRTP